MSQFINLFIPDIKEKKFVAIRRAKTDKFLGGMLALPGGRIEENETPEQAANRESIEEMGVELSTIDPNPCLSTILNIFGQQHSLLVHKATLASFNFYPQDIDIDEVLWVTPEIFIDSLIRFKYPKEEISKMKNLLSREGIL